MSGGARLVRVEDPDDPAIADYRDIRERDLVGRAGRFVAEGEVVLALLAARRPDLVRSVLVVEKRLPRIAEALARLPASVPAYVAGQAVADAIAGFHLNRGILAMADKPAPVDLSAALGAVEGPAAVPVLVGLSNHDNVGGVFRCAAAFGAPVAVLDRGTCDPFYRKAVRVSVGGTILVPHARMEAAEALPVLASRGFVPLALTPRADAAPLFGAPLPERAAFLLGAEGPGLPEALLAAARPVRIPMAGGFDSLNVAVTAGIALAAFAARHGVRTASAPAPA